VRNKIPVCGLIENELGVRCETESGIFRFECPLCGSFHTSVLENKNLARCFGCETNSDTIDIAMEVGKTGFRQSADFLTDLLESGAFEKPNARAARGPSEPVSLSRVLSSLAPADGTAERIQSLEKKVEKLGKRMDGLQKFLLDNLSERGA